MIFKDFLIEAYYKKGVYIATDLTKESQNLIKQYQKDNLNGDLNDELHCTLIYSQKPQQDLIQPKKYTYKAKAIGFSLFGPDKDTLVINLESEDMVKRNNELSKEYGFISDYDEYRPHITLSYKSTGIDLENLPKLNETLYLTNEYIEQLDTEWSN